MPRTRTSSPPQGTSDDLILAAELGGRLAARDRRQAGQDDATIRRELIGRFLRAFEGQGYDDWTLESLVAAVVRGIDEALVPNHPRKSTS